MSHYIAEIVFPKVGTEDGAIQAAVDAVMRDFCDEIYDDDGEEIGKEKHAYWWDWYLIGGRFSGHKTEARVGKERIAAFYEILKEHKVTVSNFQCGKQELMPTTQIPLVDELWRKHCPGHGDKCLLFAHARDQYIKSGLYPDDICTVADIPQELTCDRFIVADWFTFRDETRLDPKEMYAKEFWNGKTWQNTDFDGTVLSAIERAKKDVNIQPDWLCVTVDYHN